MEAKTYHVKIRFIQPILGTANPDPEIHERFIASKAPDAPSLKEEVESLGADAVEERGTTIFSKSKDGCPFLWDYQLKGFFKDACYMLRKIPGSKSKGMTTYKKDIDGLLFPKPRNIKLMAPEDDDAMHVMQRPLRAQTAQGERIALAASEMLPAGTTCEFDVVSLDPGAKMRDALIEWFTYGQLRGIGQWRNAGWGSFCCVVTDKDTGKVLLDTMG